jgi:cysteine-rich repeat protein
VKEGIEECDFGSNNGVNSGCEDGCKLSCADATTCDDGNACNGVETCDDVVDSGTGNTGKQCSAGTPEANGTGCGTDMLCINQVCTAATCGDSYTTAPEECDDANTATGDGCEANCKYSCVSTDSTRNCTPTDPCQGQGTCNDTTHVCSPGTPLANNTPCGTGGYCKNSVCTQPVCGNGTQEPGETCDDGNQVNGDGCDTDCTYSCVTPSTDCGMPPACQMYTCTAQHTCQASADTSKNGMSCGTNGETCQNGACTGGTCGNAVTESGEQCDFGTSSNGPNTGCETNCTYSCTISPNSCTDNDPCNGTETCAANMVNGQNGQKCYAGTPLADNTNCGTGKICKSQACVASVCGDGYIDASIGETCEPPNTATCDASCHVKVCGDGVRAGTEQCDDGNTTNLDGCSSTCKFEQCQRINDMKIQFSTDTYCPANALGKAAGSQAQSLITDAVDNGIADGSITVFFQMLGLDDLTGTSDPSLSLGVLDAAPVAGTGYDGHADIDWWYTVDPSGLDASRVPTATVPATIAAKVLNAGPANMKFTVNFVGVAVTMDMFRTKMTGQIQATSTPTVSTGGTPGHLASENLDPALVSFMGIGAHDANNRPTGEICGATTAASLYNTKVPAAVVTYCSNYSIDHTLLDLYIGGCTYAVLFTIIRATQPDTSRSGTDTYKFQMNSQTHRVSCTKNSGPAQLEGTAGFDDCLQNAGYTSFYKFTTDRVIGK